MSAARPAPASGMSARTGREENGPRPARHFTATGYVVRGGRTLLLFHKKLRMWLPPGGHIEEGELPEEAALREIREETGLEAEIVSPRRAPNPGGGRVRHLHVPSHVQLEHIPGGHPQHIDLIYFCRVGGGREALRADEHEGMRWHSLEDLEGPHVSAEVRETAALAIRCVLAADAAATGSATARRA